MADANQLENAILNLAINARDAMPGGGVLTIETANIRLDETERPRSGEMEPGEYTIVCVGDTGTGMSRETIAGFSIRSSRQSRSAKAPVWASR
jgi:signal transduction histidine kinase